MKRLFHHTLIKTSLACLILIFLLPQFSHASTIVSADTEKRESQYNVNFYFLSLDIEATSSVISGNVMMSATSLVNNLDTIALELDGILTVDSVQAAFNGGAFQHATFKHTGYELNVLLPFTAGDSQTVQSRVYYHGSPTVSDGVCGYFNSGFFEQSSCGLMNNGLHKFSASPPYNSSTWWPCKQVLSDKADSTWFFITTDSSYKACSNGLLTGVVTAGAKKTWQWKSHHPIAFYLISFVVSSFGETIDYWHPAGRTDSMLLIYYGYNPTVVKGVLDLYTRLYGFYHFYDEKLGLANVDLGGGMENQTMIVLGASYGGFEPHEMAHQWFGDNVTCGSWKDIMLNEGFARWSESIWDEFNSSNPDSARMTHFTDNLTVSPVYGSTMDTTTIVSVFGNRALYYDKAAMVINSLRFTINNDSLFFLGLRNYQAQFSGKNALATDLKAVMETTTGVSLTDFFNQWYYGGGGPTFNIRWVQIANQLYLKITEKSNVVSNPLFKTPVEIKIQRTQGDTTMRINIMDSVTVLTFPCPGSITGFVVDPNQWITNGHGTVTMDSTLAVVSFENASNIYAIFPNPSANTFIIKGGKNTLDVKIYNTTGQLEYANHNYKQGGNVDVSKLNAGVYFVHITEMKKEEIVKLLIER